MQRVRYPCSKNADIAWTSDMQHFGSKGFHPANSDVSISRKKRIAAKLLVQGKGQGAAAQFESCNERVCGECCSGAGVYAQEGDVMAVCKLFEFSAEGCNSIGLMKCVCEIGDARKSPCAISRSRQRRYP
jgi:hypothetical protein